MRSTRARSRFAVVAAVVPLIASAGPLVTPAYAASVSVSVYSSTIGENNVVGPNAGFRNVAQGVRGSSAVFKLDVNSASAALNNVEVRVSGFPTGPALVPDRDFAPNDGFAVWKDVSPPADPQDPPGGPDGAFGEIDYAQNPVSTGYTVGSPSGGQIPVSISIDGVRATGTTGYFVTVHPGNGAGTIENRDFKLTLPVDGVRFADATKSPSAAVETQKLTIDSKPPVQPVTTSFAPVNRPAMARQTEPKKEDAYNVSPAEYNDPDKTLVFLNDGNNVTVGNFLHHVGGAPAIYTLPQTAPISAQEMTIGDGTGVTATVKVANNNQVNDDVYVRAFDKIGNLTSAIRLTAGGVPGDTVDRSNDVTAPTFTAGTLDLNGARGVNASNVTAAPTRVQWSAPGTGSAAPTVSESRLVLSVGGTLTETATAWKAGAGTSPAVITHDTTGVGTTGSSLAIQARLTDAKGNTGDVWRSTGTFLKDTVRPSLSSVAFLTDAGNDGQGEAGDKVRVTFSEAMYKPGVTGDINNHLDFPDAAVDWGYSGTGAQDPPTFTWDGDGTALTITLGSQMPPLSTNRLPNIGDKVRALATVQDEVGNTPFGDTNLSDRFLAALPPIPLVENIRTGDVAGKNLYNQGRDGQLDRLTVTFPHPIENANVKLPENLDNFTIIGSDVQKPTAVTVNSTTSFTLIFGGAMLSGETPLLQYVPTAQASLRAGGVDVPAFTRGSSDYAAPALRLLTTSDSDANGRLDTLVATYSEAVALASELTDDNCDYSVPGYENSGGPADCLPLTQGDNIASQGPTPNVIHIALTEVASPDTHVTPSAQTAGTYKPTDTSAQENASGTGWSTGTDNTSSLFNKVLDKAPPVAVSRTTRDLNSDGRIDAIDVVYGETLAGLSVENGRYTVTNRTVERVGLLGSTGVRLFLTPIAPGRVGDTDAKPTVQYTGGPDGGITDASDQRNSVRPDAAPAATTDGAGPAITGACAGTASNNGLCPVDTATDDKINVFFSEALAASTLAVGEILVEQPAGTNKPVTAIAQAADNKSATLTLANNAIDQTKDALVRFSAANVANDAASQGNTQTGSVLAPAAPSVKLDLICPVVSPGADPRAFCGQSTVNTGAVATSGLVRFWRLKDSAPTATTPDSEYSADYPSTYPPAGQTLAEGTLTLFLSGKDDYGRVAGVSPTVSDTIRILRAPDIANVGIVNTTTPARGTWSRVDTVLDGDNVNVKATAFSDDADQWAPGGVCKAQHMSIDYRAITRNASLGAVAPFSCDLDTTSFRKSRKMTFPFVKVVGTTRYPVGTVLKQSANDPGWLIVDGPNNTLMRRQFVSVGARRSHQITDASVITVPISVLNGYPRGTRVGFRDGAVIKTSGSGYYYVYASIKRPISSGLLSAWKIPLSQVYNVSTGELNAHPTGAGFSYGAHPLGTWIRFADGSINQISRNALGQVVRRGVTSSWALRTLVPSAQIYTANHYDRAVPFDATFTRGYRDGIMVKVNSTTYGVVSRTVLRTFANATTFNTLGYNTSNAWPYSPSYLPRNSGGHSTGVPIDRYKITSVIVKATNLAGGTATKVVLPTLGGIWGVGTLDPIPGNWDRSRQ